MLPGLQPTLFRHATEPGRQADVHMHPQDKMIAQLEQQMAKVNSVLEDLTGYYKAHPTVDNEILVSTALNLDSCRLALLYLLSRVTFGEEEGRELVRLREPLADANQAARMRAAVAMIPTMLPHDRGRMRDDFLTFLRAEINALADTGRRLLKVRELRSQGASESDIRQFLDGWKTENVF
jgi:hypothetical protein